jgi:hypothetical protein
MKYQIIKFLRIAGQVITTIPYMLYGLLWTVGLLIKMGLILVSLSYHRASFVQWQLEIGRVFIIHGANLQVGQPVRFKVRDKVVTKWVKNLFYDFKKNSINTSYSQQPIKGLSERFQKDN